MSRRCVVKGCKTRDRMGVRLLCFSKNIAKRNMWLTAVGLAIQDIPTSWRICGVHFAPDAWELDRIDGTRKLKPTAVPSLNIPCGENVGGNWVPGGNVVQVRSSKGRCPFKDVTNTYQSLDCSARVTSEKKSTEEVEMANILLALHNGVPGTTVSKEPLHSLHNLPSVLDHSTDSYCLSDLDNVERSSLRKTFSLEASCSFDSSLSFSSNKELDTTANLSPDHEHSCSQSVLKNKRSNPLSRTSLQESCSFDSSLSLSSNKELDSTANLSPDCEHSYGQSARKNRGSSFLNNTSLLEESCSFNSSLSLPVTKELETTANFSIDQEHSYNQSAQENRESSSFGEALSALHEEAGSNPILDFPMNQPDKPDNVLNSRKPIRTSFEQTANTSVVLQELSHDQLISIIRRKERELEEEKEKNRKYTLQAENLHRRYIGMKRANYVYRKKIKRLGDTITGPIENLRSHLKEDQISSLCRKSTRGMKWKTETIRDAIVFKMKMGTKAYTDFIRKVPIYPSARTLQRDVKHMEFECGILHDVLQCVKPDVERMPPEHKRCVIGMDEMALQEAEIYDPGAKKMIGHATFGPHTGLAKKALTLVIGGAAKRYKFTGAYHFTSSVGKGLKRKNKEDEGNPVGEALKNLVIQLVIEVEAIGLFVDAIIHDMGPDNMALWLALGVGCSSKDRIAQCSIPHPCRPGDRLWFLPDTIHLFKNIATSLSTNAVFTLSDDVVQTEGLRCNEMKLEHLQDLVDFENNFELKCAYRLKQENLDSQKQFLKMKVANPCAIFCKRTEVALRGKAELTQDCTYDATIFFVRLVIQWFALVSNRGRKLALSHDNVEAYNGALHIIEKTAKVFKTMKIGQSWKPVQKGMIMACQALLEIQEFLLGRKLMKFLLCGRYTQDFVENLYSLVRFRLAVPNVLHFKHNLRVITLAQICLTATNSNYFRDTNEDVLLPTDFVAITKARAAVRCAEQDVQKFMEAASINMTEVEDSEMDQIDGWEWLVLYDMAGSVIRSLKKMNIRTCDECIKSLLWQDKERSHPCAALMELREFKEGVMYAVSELCFKATLKAEITFRSLRETLQVKHVDVVEFLVDNTKYVWDGGNVKDCHDITTKYLRRFFTMRFRTYGVQRRQILKAKTKQQFGSKSMAMHTSVA